VSSPFEVIPWQVLLATCTLVPLALLFEGMPRIEWSARLVALLVYGGTAGIALPYWAMQIVNKNLPAITTSLALLVVPIVGVACSAIALGEPITAGLIVAMLLIVSGIAVGMSDSILRVWAGKV
jgi:drug/metabolite transporter (DMT)-like permease